MTDYKSTLQVKIRKASIAVAEARQQTEAALALAEVSGETDVLDSLYRLQSSLVQATGYASDARGRLP